MKNLSKKKYLYFIALMLMTSTFLPLVFSNLPTVIGSHHLWTIIWSLSLLVMYPRIFFCKRMVYIYLYGLITFIATNTILNRIDDWNYRSLFMELYIITIGASVITYFLQIKDYKGLAMLTKWSMVFIFITAIMTIVSSGIDPLYARNITGLKSFDLRSEQEAIMNFRRLGGGNYSTAATFMCLFPILIYYFKNASISPFSKLVLSVFFIITFFALIGMQFFANILVAVSIIVIAIMGTKRLNTSILVVCILTTLIFIIPSQSYVNALYSASNYFEKESELNKKFLDLAIFIESGAQIEDTETTTGGRIERYPALLEVFIKKPLFGCYFLSSKYESGYNNDGAHLYWMNKLTTTGIIGLLLFIYIPYNFIRKTLPYLMSSYKFYYLTAALAILLYGFMKVIDGRETWYTFFILLPGLSYMPLLKKER
jgi:hypothetical protein